MILLNAYSRNVYVLLLFGVRYGHCKFLYRNRSFYSCSSLKFDSGHGVIFMCPNVMKHRYSWSNCCYDRIY